MSALGDVDGDGTDLASAPTRELATAQVNLFVCVPIDFICRGI